MLFGTADVDCLRPRGDEVACLSRGDSERDASDRAARSEPAEGERLLELLGLPMPAPPGRNGSVTERGRDFGRPEDMLV